VHQTLDPGRGLGHSNNPTWRQWLRLAGNEVDRIGCDESLQVALAMAKPCGGGSGGGAAMTGAEAFSRLSTPQGSHPPPPLVKDRFCALRAFPRDSFTTP